MNRRRAGKRRLSPRALGLAILVHVVLLTLVFVKIESRIHPVPAAPRQRPENVVDAVAVDNQVLEREKERKRQLELEKQRKIEEQKRIEEEKIKKAEAEKKRLAEEKKQAEARKKREAEEKKKAAVEKKRKEEAARKKREAEKKKKAEAERKRKAEAEKKRKAEAARKKREADLKRKMEAEARQRRAASAMSQYVPRIQAKVESNWRYPPGGPAGCNPTVRVTLARDGEVQSAKVVKSSGDSYCDRSVETAFMLASPIPIPQDPDLYSEFKVIDFPFRP